MAIADKNQLSSILNREVPCEPNNIDLPFFLKIIKDGMVWLLDYIFEIIPEYLEDESWQQEKYAPFCGMALYHAARIGSHKLFDTLYKLGVNINAVDDEGQTGLFLAANYNKISCLKMLLNKNVDCNLAPKDDETPLLTAAQNGHLDILKYY